MYDFDQRDPWDRGDYIRLYVGLVVFIVVMLVVVYYGFTYPSCLCACP